MLETPPPSRQCRCGLRVQSSETRMRLWCSVCRGRKVSSQALSVSTLNSLAPLFPSSTLSSMIWCSNSVLQRPDPSSMMSSSLSKAAGISNLHWHMTLDFLLVSKTDNSLFTWGGCSKAHCPCCGGSSSCWGRGTSPCSCPRAWWTAPCPCHPGWPRCR